MEKIIYAITCKRTSELGTDWYIVNPVYSNHDTAEKVLAECTEKYSNITTEKGITYNCTFSMESVKVSDRKESE